MNLLFSEQQNLLREMIVKVLSEHSTTARVRASEAQGFDPMLWKVLSDLGIPAMRVSEAAGGGDAGLLDAVVIAEEAGRRLAAVPLLEHLVATRLLEELGPGADAWLKRALAREVIVTLALRDAESAPTQIVPGASSAHAVLYLNGDVATLLETGQRFDKAENLGALDTARRALAGADVKGIVLAQGRTAVDTFHAAIEEWRLLRAAFMAGLCGEALALAAAYTRERMQFGRPVGSFQGVAHPLADSMADTDGLRLLTLKTASLAAKGAPETGAWISMASWWAADTARRCLQRTLHSFGGYGLALEYDIQLYFRRGRAWSLIEGDPLNHLNVAARRLWLGEKTQLPDAGPCELDFGWGTQADAYAAQAENFFGTHMTPALRAKAHHSTAGHDVEFQHLLAREGYAYPTWARKWGGGDRTLTDSTALGRVFEKFRWSRVTIAITNIIGRAVMEFGNDALRQEVLPALASGQSIACLGFSEPGAGSDIYATRTRATPLDGGWIISGQKMFTTGAHLSDFVILLTRTRSGDKPHEGLTIFVVPMKLPGVEVQAIETLQDERTNITFFHDVHVPDRYRLSEVDCGMKLMTFLMTMEHGGEGYHIFQNSLLEAALEWAHGASPSGGRHLDNPDVQRRLARVAAHTEISDLLCRRTVWAAETGNSTRYFGPMSKLFVTECYVEDSADLMEMAAPDSILVQGAALGEIEQKHRQSMGTRIYGGTSQIHRSLIAELGLGLPRTRG